MEPLSLDDSLVPIESLVDFDKARLSSGTGSKVEPVRGLLVPKTLFSQPPVSRAIPVALPVSLELARDWITDMWDPYDASQKPVRCMSCGRCLSHRYTPYWIEVHERKHPIDHVLDMIGIEPTMYCCKQTLMTYVSIPVKPVAKGKRVILQ